jgi:diaminopropionate ammonia-lyase
MPSLIEAIYNEGISRSPGGETIPAMYSPEEGLNVIKYHQSFPEYQPTPLFNPKNLADEMGLKAILVKDESSRFNLKAFKVLGASHAVGRIIAQKLNIEFDKMTFPFLASEAVKGRLGEMTFCTASDGNHGRGLAWVASAIGHKAVVFLPKGTVASRIKAIAATGAKTIVTDTHYDETVLIARDAAEKESWIFVQDTSFDDYQDIPQWIMQGYLTMIHEVTGQMKSFGIKRPTHVLLQVGVGSMAAAIIGYLLNTYGDEYPTTIIVEPHRAACFYESIQRKKPSRAEGNLNTIMAGLACGMPSVLAWEIISKSADFFISCDDEIARIGMRQYAAPIGDDPTIISGESGAVSLGLLIKILTDDSFSEMKDDLKLNKDSIVLLFNTEGDTDPESYGRIVGE